MDIKRFRNGGGNVLDYSFDKPIKMEQEDLFHRSAFAKQFAKDIVLLSESNNFTISLNGAWGTGKTSLINLIKNEIERIRDYDDEILSYPVIVDFSPWNCLDENGIINQFFNSIKSNFTVERIKSFLTNSKTQLALKLLQNIPYLGKVFRFLNKNLDVYLKEFLEKEKDLLQTKNEIVKKLEKIDFTFIVFIDDIDRLNNKEIRLLMQLIKAVCDFPKVVYVLSFDKGIVANALSNEQTADGEKYLEKIIQLSIDIPEISQEDLQKYLFKKLDQLIGDISQKDFDTKRWSYIFRNGFYNYFKNIRDVNRFINRANFKYSGYKSVINIVDFLTLEAISLFEPKFIKLIKDNKSVLCKSVSMNDDRRLKIVNSFMEKAKDISNNAEMIEYIFPYINLNSSVVSENNYQQYKSRGRVCYEDHFEYYFSGQLIYEGISKSQIEAIMTSTNKESKDSYFDNLTNKSYNMLLQYLNGFVEDKENIEKIINFMPDLMEHYKNFKDLTGLFLYSNSLWISGILDDIFKAKGVEYSFSWMKKIFSEISDFNLLTELLLIFAHDTGIYYETKNAKEGFFTNDQILDFHEILIKRIKHYINTDEFLQDMNLVKIIRFLNLKNRDVLGNWFKRQTKNTEHLINIIGKSVYRGYGESSVRFITYTFPFKLYESYINIEELSPKILKILSKKINGIDHNNLLGLVLFTMPKPPEDDQYTKGDINKFCKENKIEFTCEDEFIE